MNQRVKIKRPTRDHCITVFLTAAEREAIIAEAERQQMPLSALLRDALGERLAQRRPPAPITPALSAVKPWDRA